MNGLPNSKAGRGRTFAKIPRDLALILVAVPAGLDLIVPPQKGHCGMTPEVYAECLGLLILGLRPTWLALKALNDAGERWLGGPLDPKPRPLDDPRIP